MKRALVSFALALLVPVVLLLMPASTPMASVAAQSQCPSSSVPWDEAAMYAGRQVTVVGPVVSTRYASGSSGGPTFLNLGEAYPNPDRVQVIIWARNRSKFPSAPERLYAYQTICVTGVVKLYKGVPEIEVRSPSQIVIAQ